VGKQLVQQIAAFVIRQAQHAAGEMLADEQRLAAIAGMGVDHGVDGRLDLIDLRLRQRRAPGALARSVS
jgi:hypothetical protein